MRKTILNAALLLALAPLASAQQAVDLKKNADPRGRVHVDNPMGSTRIIGWDRAEVTVTGQLGRGADEVRLSGGASRTDIEIETEGNPQSVHCDLEIHVPSGSRVEVESSGAEITVSGVTTEVRAESVNGAISVSGADEVDAQTVSAGVRITGGSRVRAESVNGPVTVKGARRDVEASTVNGPLDVSGSGFDSVRMEVVSGNARFEGDLTARGDLSIETVSGSADLSFPANQSADFEITTFSGEIQNGMDPNARPTKASHFTPEKELSFTAGSGGAKVAVKTLSGSITLRKK
jgi:DUF4097 and DUF4098 domain-containing protein YvlB